MFLKYGNSEAALDRTEQLITKVWLLALLSNMLLTVNVVDLSLGLISVFAMRKHMVTLLARRCST